MKKPLHKLKPIPPYDYKIDSLETFKHLSQRQFRVFEKITVNFPTDQLPLILNPESKMQTQFAKLAKKIKFLRTSNLKDYQLRPELTKYSHQRYLAKQFSRVQNLAISNIAPTWTTSIKESGHDVRSWLKYVKQLAQFSFYSCDRYNSFSRKISLPALKNLKYQKKIQVLKIQLPSSDTLDNESKFWKLCSRKSLKTLAIDGGHFSNDAAPQISKIKDLTSISFKFNNLHNDSYLVSAIKLTTQLHHLQELNLVFDQYDLPTAESSDYTLLSKLKELKRVNFKFFRGEGSYAPRAKGFAGYLKAIEKLPLTHLGLGISITNDKQLTSVSEILKTMNKLQSFVLNIVSDYTFQENGGELKNIVWGIGKSRKIQSLDLTFKTGVRVFQRETFSDAFVEKILSVIGGLKHLENFKIFSNQFDSNKIFLGLLQVLSRNAMMFKTISIDMRNYSLPTESKFVETVELLQKFKEIRTLKLYSLCLKSREELVKLGEGIKTLKKLTDFSFGKINKKLEKTQIAEGVEAVLSKSGLRSFDWKVSKKLMDRYHTREMSADEIALINPLLREYPRDLLRVLNRYYFSRDVYDYEDEFDSQILDNDLDDDDEL